MKRKGFTLLEALVVVAIIGILTTTSICTYQKFKANGDLRRTSMNLYMELTLFHQIARQYDAKVFVKFLASQCSVYVDTNNNGSADAGDVKKAIDFPSTVSTGVAYHGPKTAPSDLSMLSGMTGSWEKQMEIKNDPVGTINGGAVYLHSKRLDKVTYCLGIAGTMLSVRQYKWGGLEWFGL